MKRLISLYFLLALIVPQASAGLISGTVLAAGDPVPAEYTLLKDGTVALGTGHNACISQYTKGRITVPSQITVSGKTYQVTRIMPLAFRLCTNTKVIIIREGIKSIGDFAFVGCNALVEVEMPSTLQSIGSGVFSGLKNLKAVICKATTPPAWEYSDVCFPMNTTGTARQFGADVPLFVPLGADAAYQGAKYTKPELGWTTPEGWGTAFTSIKASAMDGYRVYSNEDLDELHKFINNPDKYPGFKVENLYLEADIDMSEYQWTSPIAYAEEHAFSANIYGQGHYIRNLRINSNTSAGLFGYYKGKKITGLRLENCDIRAGELVGALAAQCDACTIDSCYVSAAVRTDGIGGGLVGRCTAALTVDRCYCYTHAYASSSYNPCMAGIVGSTAGATITNCAVQGSFNFGTRSGIFVGECTNGGTASIDYCYSTNEELSTPPAASSGIRHGEHVLLYGQPLSIVDYAGERHDFTYVSLYFQTLYPASVLGFDSWAYTNEQFPLPDCFADLWPVKPNLVVYGSKALAEQRVNALTPDENIPASAWLDLSDMGFRHYSFKASQLWIDGNMSVFGRSEQLPLGLSKQITVENGVLLEDTLRAGNKGTVPVYEPVYLTNDNKEPALDANGNMIRIDSLFLFNKTVWEEKVYSLCLPYSMVLSGNCSLYQPIQVYDVDGQTTALFGRVRDNYVEAFRPYLVVLRNESVPLGTMAKVICPALDSKSMRLADYEFEGTVTRKGNIAARESNDYMLEDTRHWLRFKDSDDLQREVEPFTAYFHAVSGTPAKRINIVLDDDNPVISVGDFYYAINNQDAENVTARLVGYHGRGGNVVVPGTAPYVLYGQEQQVPIAELAPDIFTKSTAQVWSIDMSQCTGINPVSIERGTAGNPFYKVDERTIIYMPEGKAQAGKNNVIGKECQQLTLTDGWDFVPPYSFHADEAIYDRIFYAAKQPDGSYKNYAYTVCVPFTMKNEEFMEAIRSDNLAVLNMMRYFNAEQNSLVFSSHPGDTEDCIVAGRPYVLNMKSGEFQIKAHDTQVLAQPVVSDEFINLYNEEDVWHLTHVGDWMGTFARISNEDAALMNAYTLNGNGKWYRIRSEEGRYRSAWVGAFRGYFKPQNPLPRNSYATDFVALSQGGDDDPSDQTVYCPFDAENYATDSDFSKYDEEGTGIDSPQSVPAGKDADAWFTMDGRKLSGKPQTRGLYIYKGRKVVINNL